LYVGIFEAPDNKTFSENSNNVVPCLRAKNLPFQPFEPESVIVIFKVKMFVQPEPGQKVAKILDCPKFFLCFFNKE
jgi:hypothetical protein